MSDRKITVVVVSKDRVACRDVRSHEISNGYLTVLHANGGETVFAPGQWTYFTVGGIGDG